MITYRVTTWTEARCKRSYAQAEAMMNQVELSGCSAILIVEGGPLDGRVERVVGPHSNLLVERHLESRAEKEKSRG